MIGGIGLTGGGVGACAHDGEATKVDGIVGLQILRHGHKEAAAGFTDAPLVRHEGTAFAKALDLLGIGQKPAIIERAPVAQLKHGGHFRGQKVAVVATNNLFRFAAQKLAHGAVDGSVIQALVLDGNGERQGFEDFLGQLHALEIKPPLVLALLFLAHILDDTDAKARWHAALDEANPAILAEAFDLVVALFPVPGDLRGNPAIAPAHAVCRSADGKTDAAVIDRAEEVAKACSVLQHAARHGEILEDRLAGVAQEIIAIINENGRTQPFGHCIKHDRLHDRV